MLTGPWRKLLAVLLLAAGGAVAGYGYLLTPPEITRLLPEADGIVYANLAPLRALTHPNASATQREASYQHFIDATGIIAERDLDAAALALHQMPDPRGPNGVVGYSEVLRGRFDRDRLERYLGTLTAARELYAGHTIYLIPSEGRTVRLTILDDKTVAASNLPTPEQIHVMLDRSSAPLGSAPETTLLSRHFADVPALASAWGLGELALPFVDANAPAGQMQVMGLSLPERADTFFVASVRLGRSPQLRVEQIAASETEAARADQTLASLLDLYRSIQVAGHTGAPSADDAVLKQTLDSIQLVTVSNRVILTVEIPFAALQRIAAATK